ncbi:MAG: alpha-amylase family glycosyl hydrolase [Promethearchaeota archaeon]
MKIKRNIRLKYELNGNIFSQRGDIDFGGDIQRVRKFVEKINQKKELIKIPEPALRTGLINGVDIIFEVYNYLLKIYKKEINQENLNEELHEYLREEMGDEDLEKILISYLEEFPPPAIFNNELTPKEYLEKEIGNRKNEVLLLEDLIILWIGNENPSFTQYLEFFDDEILEKTTNYSIFLEKTITFFENKPPFGPKNESIIEMLQEPSREHPNSIKDQLEYILKNWSHLIGDLYYKILLALDLINEEERLRGLGAGESKVYVYDLSEEEHYTPDKDWMPKVVMIAKNVYVWLDQLSKKYGRNITKLHEIPDEELDILSNRGFTALWLIGVWDRSQASKTIKRWCGNPEAEASAYSIYDYVISPDLGGPDSFYNLKERAWRRGIRLACDMVPNHMGIVSKWTIEHPDWFISLPYPPFPSYSYTGANLSGHPNIGIYLEDKYYTRTDAAVTFKHVEFNTGITRYIYHGNDGTHLPWNDTAQLNYLLPEVREAVIQKIIEISRIFPIIRFDAAMTLTKKHYQRLWFPEPGTGGAIPSRAEHGLTKEEFDKAMPNEFWREVVDRINIENPDTLLLAEAFWLLEGYFVRTLGMHRVYNSAFMNMLRDEDNAKYRQVLKNTLEFDPQILKRFVNFMNNPDEETAIKQFGTGDKYFGTCTLLVTMPGLPLFGHGQIEGFKEKYGMEYRRAYWNEEIDWDLVKHHEDTIFPLMKKRYLFADVEHFVLYDFWEGDHVNEDVFAYSNRYGNEKALVIYHNKFAETRGYIKNSVAFKGTKESETLTQTTLAEALDLPKDNYCIFKDFKTGLEYIRKNADLHEKGLYIELFAYKVYVFMEFQVVRDNEFFHYAKLHEFLGGRGVPNIQEALQQIIYQPLHNALSELLNKNMYEKILNMRMIDSNALEEIAAKLHSFFQLVKKYTNRHVIDDSIIVEEILTKIKIIKSMELLISEISIPQDLKRFLIDLPPQDEFENAILLTWNFIHLIGKLNSKENHERESIYWIEEWRLTEVMRNILEKFKFQNTNEIENAIALIKIMILYQKWFFNIDINDKKSEHLLIQIFGDNLIKSFLKVNQFQGKLWFNAEAFDSLIKWLSLLAIINSFVKKDSYSHERLKDFLITMRSWKSAALKSEYQVKNVIDIIKSKNL